MVIVVAGEAIGHSIVPDMTPRISYATWRTATRGFFRSYSPPKIISPSFRIYEPEFEILYPIPSELKRSHCCDRSTERAALAIVIDHERDVSVQKRQPGSLRCLQLLRFIG
jgi:hypothetical protein